jgi:gag-polypeptide of LTR copia-type
MYRETFFSEFNIKQFQSFSSFQHDIRAGLNLLFISATFYFLPAYPKSNMSQQSDNTKLTAIILTGNNYIPWSRSVTIGLGGKDKLNFVTGTKTKLVPAKANEATAEERAKIEE